ncbi:hypothetical protein [Methylobacterium sp. J-068]|uniref:hypothetical protein n=1 Tax=Methylobacterium sp. J-068 TaxID=2836649 RepID=UPI001FB8C346|nr:hypothetical protein [Methylobacterium sp. J-068]MCJ2032999.1 hypothetical protein [Methylobacterium sp. J-068]
MAQSTGTGDLGVYARSLVEIEARAKKFKNDDPFPKVPPALLSSAEILDYDRATGMTGFHFAATEKPHDGRLKAASLEIHIGGDYIYWKGKKKIEKTLKEEDTFLKLPANSIVFVQTRNKFFLPNYIAMRFNLRITHVHRGLLLGTGPLVDPGFQGRLLIPLHNLTSSDYYLDTSKALIWVEFTKTSANFEKSAGPTLAWSDPDRRVLAIEGYKNNNSPSEYLYKAGGGLPIASSIPTAVRGARRDAKQARQDSEKVQAWVRGFGLLAVLGAVVGITGIVNTTWNLVQTANIATSDVKARVAVLEAKTGSLVDAERVAPKVEGYGARLDVIERRLVEDGELKDRLGAVEARNAKLLQAVTAAEFATNRAATSMADLERRISTLEQKAAAKVLTPIIKRKPKIRQNRRTRINRQRG